MKRYKDIKIAVGIWVSFWSILVHLGNSMLPQTKFLCIGWLTVRKRLGEDSLKFEVS